jgi:hypothetical protein
MGDESLRINIEINDLKPHTNSLLDRWHHRHYVQVSSYQHNFSQEWQNVKE